jgi:hypothetical protein
MIGEGGLFPLPDGGGRHIGGAGTRTTAPAACAAASTASAADPTPSTSRHRHTANVGVTRSGPMPHAVLADNADSFPAKQT